MSICGNACIIGDDVGGGGGRSVLGVNERLCDVGVFDDVGRTTTGTSGVDELLAVVVVIAVAAVVVVSDGGTDVGSVFNGDLERRCVSKIFSVSVPAVVMVVVVTVADDVKQGVRITSRTIFGIDVDLDAVTDAEDDDNGLVSTIEVIGSLISGAAVVVAGIVGVPFATSSMISSICDRDEVVAGVVVVVTAGLSMFILDDETIFETMVMRSFCCVEGVEALVVTAVV